MGESGEECCERYSTERDSSIFIPLSGGELCPNLLRAGGLVASLESEYWQYLVHNKGLLRL